MIINRIYINRFGGLSDFSLDLSRGFNLIFGNNEDGKTTVMSFLRMMFYSTGTSKSDVKLNLRKRFSPFSGEKASGEVEFSHGGKDYILSKQFGKSAHSDKVTLLDLASGKPVPVSGDIGEQFFGMTWEAFERSIFIGSLASEGKGSAELSSKLKATVYTGDTGDSYEDIFKRLADGQALLRTKKRVGVSDRLEDRLTVLQNEIKVAKSIQQRREENGKTECELQQKIDTLYTERDALKKDEASSRNAQLAAALKTELDEREYLETLTAANGDFNSEKLIFSETLLTEISELSAKIDAQKTVIGDGPTTENSNIDSELMSALDELETANSLLLSAQNEVELLPTGARKRSTLGYFVSAAFISVGAVLGILFKWLFLLAIPAILLLILGCVAVKRNDDITRQNELILIEKKQNIAALEEKKRAANDRYIILTERKKLLDSSAAARQDEILRQKENLKLLSDSLKEKTVALCSLLGADSADNIRAVIDGKRDTLNRLAECKRRLEISPHRDIPTEEIKEKLSNTPQTDLKPADWYLEKISLLEREISNQISTLERLKAENRNLLLSHRGVAEIETEINDVNTLLSAQNEHFDALGLALDVLSEANDEMRQNFAPELNRLTSELFYKITNGKHGRVTVSSELSLTVSQDGEVPFSSDYLSAGGLDQAELCLRLAIAQLTGADNNLPLLLDDVLMQYDDTRAADAISFLSDYAKDKQVLLFTCHGYFKDLSRRAGATVIDIRK